MQVQTNTMISETHLANFRAEAKKAGSAAELRKIAEKHAPFLLKKERDEASRIYRDRRQQFGGQDNEQGNHHH
ncbi:MAG: hypothetical protein LBO00_01740 [Zoogloeaceae bacterium]|jgi:hypothetical protein|nr:hypothetical protein [Zoogloeaceae bacterium]